MHINKLRPVKGQLTGGNILCMNVQFMDAFTNGIPGILINNTKLMISPPPPLHQLFAQID